MAKRTMLDHAKTSVLMETIQIKLGELWAQLKDLRKRDPKAFKRAVRVIATGLDDLSSKQS